MNVTLKAPEKQLNTINSNYITPKLKTLSKEPLSFRDSGNSQSPNLNSDLVSFHEDAANSIRSIPHSKVMKMKEAVSNGESAATTVISLVNDASVRNFITFVGGETSQKINDVFQGLPNESLPSFIKTLENNIDQINEKSTLAKMFQILDGKHNEDAATRLFTQGIKADASAGLYADFLKGSETGLYGMGRLIKDVYTNHSEIPKAISNTLKDKKDILTNVINGAAVENSQGAAANNEAANKTYEDTDNYFSNMWSEIERGFSKYDDIGLRSLAIGKTIPGVIATAAGGLVAINALEGVANSAKGIANSAKEVAKTAASEYRYSGDWFTPTNVELFPNPSFTTGELDYDALKNIIIEKTYDGKRYAGISEYDGHTKTLRLDSRALMDVDTKEKHSPGDSTRRLAFYSLRIAEIGPEKIKAVRSPLSLPIGRVGRVKSDIAQKYDLSDGKTDDAVLSLMDHGPNMNFSNLELVFTKDLGLKNRVLVNEAGSPVLTNKDIDLDKVLSYEIIFTP